MPSNIPTKKRRALIVGFTTLYRFTDDLWLEQHPENLRLMDPGYNSRWICWRKGTRGSILIILKVAQFERGTGEHWEHDVLHWNGETKPALWVDSLNHLSVDQSCLSQFIGDCFVFPGSIERCPILWIKCKQQLVCVHMSMVFTTSKKLAQKGSLIHIIANYQDDALNQTYQTLLEQHQTYQENKSKDQQHAIISKILTFDTFPFEILWQSDYPLVTKRGLLKVIHSLC